MGYSPWGCKVSDMTERLTFHFPNSIYALMMYIILNLPLERNPLKTATVQIVLCFTLNT